MSPILKVVAAALAGVALYGAFFGLIIDKPLSIGILDRVLSKKENYARSIEGNKIIVAAGSSGFYGVRCETIADALDMPCVNMSMAVALGRETIMEQVKQVAHRGDVVLLPWEFRLYFQAAEDMRARISYPYIIRHNKRLIPALGKEHLWEAYFYFDINYVFHALLETARYGSGRRHGFDDEERMTLQGDYRGHSAAAAEKFRAAITQARSSAYESSTVADLTAPPDELATLLDWAARRGVLVIGTLPPSIDIKIINGKAVKKLQAWFNKGGGFIVLDGYNQYPASCFYDTREHLNEPCQINHSKRLAAALAPLIGKAAK